MKVIFHLDLDSYFVSANRTIDSRLIDKPVAITTREARSIISAASYEAKAYGVFVPMPFREAKKICPSLIASKPNFPLYTALSSQVFELISQKFTPKIEIASIDECYIDVTEIWKQYGSPSKLASVMQKSILTNLRLPCSIGIAQNKFVAKMSTSVNKPQGITITKPGEHAQRFWSWPLIEYYGIGKSSVPKLNNIGYQTIGDLAKAEVSDVFHILGNRSQAIIAQANGYGDDQINFEKNELKSIGNSTTFMSGPKTERRDILKTLSELTSLVTRRASARNLVGRVVWVQLKKSAPYGQSKLSSRQITLSKPIGEFEDILREATHLFNDLWDESPIFLLGVGITKLQDIFEISYQMSIFDEVREASKIEQVMNEVNETLKQKVVVSLKERELNVKKQQNQSRYIDSERIIKHYDEDY